MTNPIATLGEATMTHSIDHVSFSINQNIPSSPILPCSCIVYSCAYFFWYIAIAVSYDRVVKLQIQPRTLITLLILVLSTAMAFQMPGFLSRLARPFTTSMSRPLQPDALAATPFPPNTERAIFAGGCFWGLEELYRKDWGHGKGLLDCRVGYTGGHKEAPTYNEVCSASTGHAEALLIAFDPDKVSYRQLVEYFFKMHDPTTMNRQGADTGPQYRSAIFTESDEQMKIANDLKEKARKEWYKGKPISTEIKKATQWYDAEPKHQNYLEDAGPWGYHCPAHFVRPFPKLSE